MSVRSCNAVTAAVVAMLLVATASTPWAAKPQKPPRAALEVTTASYEIIQNGKSVGSEQIVRTVYNDNTVELAVHATLDSQSDVSMSQDAELLLREDSRFPLRYHQNKIIDHPNGGVDLELDIEMVSNVAVMETKTSSATQAGTRRIVLPSGTAFMETGVVYVYYPLLFWYDGERGGRQNFETLDVATGKLGAVVVQKLTSETITLGEEEVEAEVFLVERERFNVTLYVGGDGRILRVDQNYMLFDLTEWSREGGKADSGSR